MKWKKQMEKIVLSLITIGMVIGDLMVLYGLKIADDKRHEYAVYSALLLDETKHYNDYTMIFYVFLVGFLLFTAITVIMIKYLIQKNAKDETDEL